MIPSKKSLLKLDGRDELNEPFDKFEKPLKILERKSNRSIAPHTTRRSY
jgi:hypothetical protein